MKRVALTAIVASCVFVVPVSAATSRVPGEYPSIQMAIQASNHGDTVLVSPGVYYETINFVGKNIVVTGTDPNDPKIVGYTIIDADGDGSAVTFENGETSAAVLTGFTITGGFGTLNNGIEGQGMGNVFWGAGIYCIDSSPTITRNIITRNYGPTSADLAGGGQGEASYGGGIAAIFCSPIITHNTIRNNTGLIGGGLILYIGSAVVANNVITDNSSYIGGGVIQIGGSLMYNTIANNDCDIGGGQGIGGNVYALFDPQFGRMEVVGNIISGALSGGGILWRGDMASDVFRYNNVWNNAMANYIVMDAQTGAIELDGDNDRNGTMGNISQDPRFVNPLNRDYHLTFESPCINGGDPGYAFAEGQIDIDGQPRVYGSRIDIGADEYVGYVPPVAFAGYDQHLLKPLETVTLDGSQSSFYDPCSIKTFRWTQVDGAPVVLSDANSATPTFLPESMGEYAFELVVADDRYASDPDRVVVLVADNQPPIADAGPDGVWEMPGRAVLDGSGSHDPDRVDRLRYTWTQVGGPPVELSDADTARPSFACDVEGQYAFELVVSDGFVTSQPSQMQGVTVGVTKALQMRSVAPATEGPAYYPDISGSKVVYVTGLTGGAWQIACKDLHTGAAEQFTAGGVNLQPKVDGDLVVWSGGASFGVTVSPQCAGVYIHNLTTGVQQTLRAATETSSFSHPAVSGNKVVWVEHRGLDRNNADTWYNMPYDICGADVSDLQKPRFFTIAIGVGRRDPLPLTNLTGDSDVLDIYDDMVVWEAQGDIYAAYIHDTNDIRVCAVCDNPARQYDLAISGRLVVWTDERNDEGDIYGADISDLDDIREFVVARKPGVQWQPAIDGCQTVYVNGSGFSGSVGLACVTRKHGVLNVDLAEIQGGAMPVLDGTALIWLQGSNSSIQGAVLSFGYSIFDGRVQNAQTSRRYDFVQHAISDAGPGEQIVLEQGAYLEKIDFAGKAVTVRSVDPADPAVVSGTVLQGRGTLVTFARSEDVNSVLDGLTILWGSEGICCYGASPTIRRCNITANHGAGLRLENQSRALIADCRITANDGAGIEMSATQQGRAVRYSQGTVRNCIIAANRHEGIRGGKPTITNCTIVENCGEGIIATVPTVTNSIVYFNNSQGDGTQINSNFATVTYCDVEGGWPGDGNIQEDPLFVELGHWVGADEATGDPGAWWSGDYHLQSQGLRWNAQTRSWVSDPATSPCIDAGDPASPLLDEPVSVTQPGGEPYPNTRIDMGAYGGTPEASLAPVSP
ncbi:MAG: right-handed parallel beta-helix repeat-containing protein [Sedimentisphaerales bacterium]|nr:right-handed parallel beta-helix repeat-containing protein [Sedimentisphaerales bacterium]